MFLSIFACLAAFWVLWYLVLPYLRYLRFIKYSGLPDNIFVYPFIPFIGAYIYQNQTRPDGSHLEFTKRRFQKLGPNCRALATNLGPKNMVVLLDSKYIKDFYEQPEHFQKWEGITNLLVFVAGRGLIFQERQFHRRDRGIISSAFSFSYLSQSTQKINQTISSKLDTAPKEPFLLYEFFSEVAAGIILKLFLGLQSIDQQINGVPLQIAFTKQYALLSQVFCSPCHIVMGKIPKKTVDLTAAITQGCNKIVKQKIRKLGKTQDRGDIIGRLCAIKHIDVDDAEAIENVVAQLKNFMVGGIDTTASLMTMCIYFLTQNPLIYQQLKKEARNYNPQTSALTATAGAAECPQIDGYIKEILRLYGPVNTLVPREALNDVVLDDMLLPKGTVVSILHEYNHCHEKFYKKPYEIRPERWFNGETANLEPFAYITFSAGSRNCIGQHLARLESRLILINFLRKYDFEVQQPFKPIADVDNVFDFFKMPLAITVKPLNI